MKAIITSGYGGADQLSLRDVPEPTEENHEILLEVHAAGVNPVDWKIREG